MGGSGAGQTRASPVGGGGYSLQVLDVTPFDNIVVSVGEGGASVPANTLQNGNNGQPTCFGPVCAAGGGGGLTQFGGPSPEQGGTDALLYWPGSYGRVPTSVSTWPPGGPAARSSGLRDIANLQTQDGLRNTGEGGSGGSSAYPSGKGGAGFALVTWFTLSSDSL